MIVNPISNPNLAYAVRLVHATCCLAGSASFVDDICADLRRRGIVRLARRKFERRSGVLGVLMMKAGGYLISRCSVRRLRSWRRRR